MENMYYIWGAVVLASIILEAATTHLITIWFVPSALAAVLLNLLGVPIGWQIGVFVVLSAVLIIFARPLLNKLLLKKPFVPTNADRLIGMTGTVLKEIDNLRESGEVKVSGEIWSARSESGDKIPAGSFVTVRAIEGVKLICEIAADQPQE